MVSPARWPIRPHPATSSDAAYAPENRKLESSGRTGLLADLPTLWLAVPSIRVVSTGRLDAMTTCEVPATHYARTAAGCYYVARHCLDDDGVELVPLRRAGRYARARTTSVLARGGWGKDTI